MGIADELMKMQREKTGALARPTAEQCAAIAKENGLTMADADALHRLAGSVEEARRMAATFKPEDPMHQLTREDLKGMPPEEIVQAQETGRLDDLLHRTGASTPPEEKPPVGQLSRSEMLNLSPDEQVAAREAGELDHLLGITRPAEK